MKQAKIGRFLKLSTQFSFTTKFGVRNRGYSEEILAGAEKYFKLNNKPKKPKLPHPRDLHGLFAVNKPRGLSSTRMIQVRKKRCEYSQKRLQPFLKKIQKIRGMLGGRHIKIGHGGTLDPEAEGVLVVGLGRFVPHKKKTPSCWNKN